MSSKTTITNRPSHRLFAVTKAEGQHKASWLEIGAAWPNKDGKGYSLKLKALPMPGAEIVLRIEGVVPAMSCTLGCSSFSIDGHSAGAQRYNASTKLRSAATVSVIR